ncbi:MAG TPA: T9SS sorting signal type C domain-containing protein, partial [Flavobacterium sp.]
NDEVPLGYKTTIDGTFSINIQQVDGLLANQEVFIEDKLTNTEFDLKSGNYTFSTTVGTFNDRFVLKYKSSQKTLGTGDFDAQTSKVLVSVKNKQIKINASAETIKNVVVYDVSGRQIYQKDNVNSNELVIANLVSSNQVLIVKTTLQNGTTTTDKIVY